ncbi:hypothetical protein ACQE92_06605 [Ornithinimicrobium sp. Y1694]
MLEPLRLADRVDDAVGPAAGLVSAALPVDRDAADLDLDHDDPVIGHEHQQVGPRGPARPR